MSSPLSSLRKGARNPNLPGHIPGHRPIPFRHPEYSEDESKLLEEVTTSMAASRLQARDPFSGGLPKLDASPNPSYRAADNNNADDGKSSDSEDGGLPPPTDRDLMKLMMARLAVMEKKVQQQEQNIRTKDRRIKVLEDKLRIMGKAREENCDTNTNGACVDDTTAGGARDSNNSQKRVRELESHCLLLQQQVHEMETFLSDYGMVWVGEQDDPESDLYLEDTGLSALARKEQQLEAGLDLEDAETARGEPFCIDFDRLLQNIRDLNVIAGEGEARVQHTVDGARLVRPKLVPVTFYANGMLMFEGPFRPYSEPSSLQCVQDFLDGYFPTELQTRYPEGVPFDARDMRSVFFKPKVGTDVFSGVGQALGGEVQPSRLLPTKLGEGKAPPAAQHGGGREERDRTKHATTSAGGPDDASVTSDPPFPRVGLDQFLNHLPKSVVQQGKVIDIRRSVGKALTGQEERQPGVAVVETAVTRTIQKAISEAKVDRPKTPRDITTLRIKSESGSHTYIVKMRFKETVGDLRRYLDAHRTGEAGASREYEIFSTYPRKLFSEDGVRMDDGGLIPNGVLYLQAKRKT